MVKYTSIIDWHYSCEIKVPYPKESSAIRAAKEMNAKENTRNSLEHYKCQFCDGWHVGRKKNGV